VLVVAITQFLPISVWKIGQQSIEVLLLLLLKTPIGKKALTALLSLKIAFHAFSHLMQRKIFFYII